MKMRSSSSANPFRFDEEASAVAFGTNSLAMDHRLFLRRHDVGLQVGRDLRVTRALHTKVPLPVRHGTAIETFLAGSAETGGSFQRRKSKKAKAPNDESLDAFGLVGKKEALLPY